MKKSIALSAKNNPKKFWSFVRSKTSIKTGIPDSEYESANGNLVKTTSNEEKASVLDTFFRSVYTIEPPGDTPVLEKRCLGPELSELVVSPEKVENLLLNLNTNKSPGTDNIHPIILHELRNFLAVPLSTIMSLSLPSGYLPEDWRMANISPIFKKGSKKSANNYRLVDLASICCKLMESLVRDAVIKHLTKNKLLSG